MTLDEKPVEQSTFDVVKVDELHNTRFWTVLCYLGLWFFLLLKLSILGADTYTCVSILAFDRWSSDDVQVYEFKVAKWIFTGCIIFRFLLLAWQIAWAIHIYRTHNIALAYLNNCAALMYKVRSYDYHCLFHAIEMQGFVEWAAFLIYFNLDDALEVLVADLPRQVINVLTLREYATDGSTNVLENIKTIATTNVRLAVVLSVQLLSVVIFAFFFFRFVFSMILFIPLKVRVSDKGFRLFKAFCYLRVNDKVRFLVSRNHKPRSQLLAEGIMDAAEIKANPLLASLSTFDLAHPTYETGFYDLALLLQNLPHDYSARDYTAPARTYASSLRDGNRQFARNYDRNASASSLTEFAEYSEIAGRGTPSALTHENPFVSSFQEYPSVRDLDYTSSASGREDISVGVHANPFTDSSVAETPFVEKLKLAPELEETLNHSGTLDHWDTKLISKLHSESRAETPEPADSFTVPERADSHDWARQWARLDSQVAFGQEDANSPLLEQKAHYRLAPYPDRGVSKYFENDN